MYTPSTWFMNVSDYISRCMRNFAPIFLFAPLCVSLFLASNSFAQDNSRVAELLHLGANSMRSGQTADALRYFTEASELAPRVAEIKLNIALALRDEGKYEEEISALHSALKLNPSLKGANFFLGVAFYKLDEYDKAREALKRELKLNSRDAQVLMWMGVVDLAANDPEAAGRSL